MPSSPWNAFDTVTGHAALPHVWQAELGEYLPAFKILCLRQTDRPGGIIPCPKCDCYHRIVLRHDRTGAIAICRCSPATCPDITLTMDEVTPLEVQRPRLGRALAQALGCQVKIAQVNLPATLQFGSWSAEAVPILFTLQTDPLAFRRVIAELGLTLARPYILFAPTNTFMTPDCQQLLAHARAGFFTMEATVRLTERGTLEAIKPAAELFAAFTPESELAHLPSAICHSQTPRYALRKHLGVWELYFDHQRALIKHERGLFYVHWLLYHPDETPIHAIDLMAKVPEIYRQQLGLPALVDQSTGKTVTLESHARLQERSLALDDRQTMRAILKKQKELEAILDSDATEPEKAEALRELEEIIEFQKHYARRSKDNARTTSHAVRQGIKRVHQHLTRAAAAFLLQGSPLPKFAAHLQDRLLTPSRRTSSSASITYQPSHGITWSP